MQHDPIARLVSVLRHIVRTFSFPFARVVRLKTGTACCSVHMRDDAVVVLFQTVR